jgi:hypothetical protein
VEFYIPRPEGAVTVDVAFDDDHRIITGSALECAVRIQSPGVLPVHAYIWAGSNHLYCYLAPGARLLSNGREVVNNAPPTDDLDFKKFMMVTGRHIEIAGVRVDVPHSVG